MRISKDMMNCVGMIRTFSHEAEDVYDIPDELRNDDLLAIPLGSKDNPSIHRALNESRGQGKRNMKHLMRHDSDFRVRMPLLSLEGRRDSFLSKSWAGPCVTQMTEAGLYFRREQVASCSFCEVSIRGWMPHHCPWLRHKTFSPFCAYLRRKGERGIRPSASGKRIRHDSFSSFEEMKTGCAND